MVNVGQEVKRKGMAAKFLAFCFDDTLGDVRHAAVDFLYFSLGVFTHLYGAMLTLLFFAKAGSDFPAAVGVLAALENPYMGALGVYVLLKEVRKRFHQEDSRHYGEYFVAAWSILLLVSTLLTLFTHYYSFDIVYKLILSNSIATIVFYIGGLIHRP